MDWYMKVLREYATFSGRARRKEYWMFTLVNFLIMIGLAIVDGVLGIGGDLGLLSLLYSVAVIIPSIAVGVRRLHDTGRSGWWLFVVLIPLIGIFVLLFFLFTDSQPGANQYGPNPKGANPGMAPATA